MDWTKKLLEFLVQRASGPLTVSGSAMSREVKPPDDIGSFFDGERFYNNRSFLRSIFGKNR